MAQFFSWMAAQQGKKCNLLLEIRPAFVYLEVQFNAMTKNCAFLIERVHWNGLLWKIVYLQFWETALVRIAMPVES